MKKLFLELLISNTFPTKYATKSMLNKEFIYFVRFGQLGRSYTLVHLTVALIEVKPRYILYIVATYNLQAGGVNLYKKCLTFILILMLF